METGKLYKLNVSMRTFAEKTLKVEFAQYIEKCEGVISPDSISVGEFEDTAIFVAGALMYELPSLYWKYFEETDDIVSPQDKPVPSVTVESANINKVMGSSHNMSYALKTFEEPRTLSVNPDIILSESLQQICTEGVNKPSDREVFDHYLEMRENKMNSFLDGLTKDQSFEVVSKHLVLTKRRRALSRLRFLINHEEIAVNDMVDLLESDAMDYSKENSRKEFSESLTDTLTNIS